MKNDMYEIDIETYFNYFQIGFKNFKTKKTFSYEVSEEFDDRQKIYDWFNNYNGYLVTFNGVFYDCVVIKALLKDWMKLRGLSVIAFCKQMKFYSDIVINTEGNYELVKEYKFHKIGWTDIDLFLYWAKMLRMSKKISLKSLGIQLGYPVVQELPFNPSTILKKEDLPILRHYNLEHDLGILDLLCTKLMPEIGLRADIKKEYNLECMSWDAPKIASEALLKAYCDIKNLDRRQVRATKFTRPRILLGDILKGFNPNFKLKVFQDLFERIKNSVNTFSEEFIVEEGDTRIKMSYGIGGIHTLNSNEKYYSEEGKQIVTSDVASLYPNLIINHKTIRYPEVLKIYSEIKDLRIIAKKNKEKKKDLFYKLILNGISGLIDQEYSWLYYPEGAMKLRLIGQLILTKVIEICILNNWRVISCNTDGIEVIINNEDFDKYTEALKAIEEQFNLVLEHEKYKQIVYSNVRY